MRAMGLIWALLLGALLISVPGVSGAEELAVAVFARNRADGLDGQVDSFSGLLEARLVGAGYRVITSSEVIERFRSGSDPELAEALAVLKGEKDDTGVPDASILRLGQMMGADLIAVATLDTLGRRRTRAAAFGVTNEVTEYTLRASLKVLDAAGGGAAWGDSVTVSEKIPGLDGLEVEQTPETFNSLLDTAAAELARSMKGQAEKLASAVSARPGQVPFEVSAGGVDGATVELDGLAIGSTGTAATRFYAAPGIHTIRITREWFQPWERRINIYPDQKLAVAMELSADGLAKYKDLEGFKTAMAIAREQSEADAYAKKQLADGEKKRLEESYERIDTSKAEVYAPVEEKNMMIDSQKTGGTR